jgi:hypothetical protein
MQKTLLRNPAFFLYQIVMHDSDLPYRAAKANKTEF